MNTAGDLILLGCALLLSLQVQGCNDDGAEPPIDEFPGLSAPVDLYRDAVGGVHLFGETDQDVAYASGYAQARDRLFQMDLVRRQALGRQAEVFGADLVAEDRTLRSLDLTRWGRESAELMREQRPDDFRLIVAWTAGINARVEEVLAGEAPLPYGFGPEELDYAPERWEVEEAFTIGKLILFSNDGRLDFELLTTVAYTFFPAMASRVALTQSLTDAFIIPPGERPDDHVQEHRPAPLPSPRSFSPDELRAALEVMLSHVRLDGHGASNNWAVDGRHTANGRPLIAGDPHQPLYSPSRFFLQHLSAARGSLDVIGFAFVGSPGVQLGHNRHVAWTGTTMGADVLDLWDVSLNDGVVSIGGEPVEVVQTTETIVVRDGEPVELVLQEVPGLGYILPEDITPLPLVGNGRAILLRWTGLKASLEASAFLAIDRSDSIEAFEAAVDSMELGSFNWMAADQEGITYRNNMFVPDRGAPAGRPPAYMLLPGDDPETFWTGERLPPERMPRSRATERGWLASANNEPFGFTEDGDLSNDPWYFGAFFDPGTRAARIGAELKRLVEGGDITREDMQALQLDTHTILADQLIPVIEEVFAAIDTDLALAEWRDRPDLEQLVTLICDDWDRRMEADSAGALAFHAVLSFLTRQAVRDDLVLVYDAIMDAEPIIVMKLTLLAVTGASVAGDDVLQLGRDQTVMLALDEAASYLTDRFGGVDPSLYSWGEVHGVHFRNAFGGRLYRDWMPASGADGTIACFPGNFFDGDEPAEHLRAGSGPIYRMVAGFDEEGVPEAVLTFAPGNSGDPDSPFFDDALLDWFAGNSRPLVFDRADVEADAVERVTLEPGRPR